jgi:D-3-phosphoglycerate dehydrogenase
MPDVLIAEDIRGNGVDALSARFDVSFQPDLWRDPVRLATQLGEARALIVRNQTTVDAALLRSAKKLLVIGRAGVGLDNVDVAAATRAGTVVTYTPDQNAISVAELAIGLMISLARNIPAASADTQGGKWSRRRFWGTELYGKSFGIIGAGRIGFLTARRAQALGMKILACDPLISRDNVLLSELSAESLSLEDLLTRADVISCHLPATPKTTKLLDAACFARMKPTAIFLNTSRGQVVDEAALLAALKRGELGGAGLDVRAKEPPEVSELEKLPNVLLTPHIGALTYEAQDRVTAAICEDVARVLDGKAPFYAVRHC